MDEMFYLSIWLQNNSNLKNGMKKYTSALVLCIGLSYDLYAE
jgi:hypothetical protein